MGPQPSIGDAPNVPAARRGLSNQIAELTASGRWPVPDYTGVKKSTIQIPMRDGSKIKALLYQPEHPPVDGSALAIFYHGGGFCFGMPEMEEGGALECVKHYGAVSLCVDYRMAPEFPFPHPINDCFDAMKWVSTFLFPSIVHSIEMS